jgi:hypothetical protein
MHNALTWWILEIATIYRLFLIATTYRLFFTCSPVYLVDQHPGNSSYSHTTFYGVICWIPTAYKMTINPSYIRVTDINTMTSNTFTSINIEKSSENLSSKGFIFLFVYLNIYIFITSNWCVDSASLKFFSFGFSPLHIYLRYSLGNSIHIFDKFCLIGSEC